MLLQMGADPNLPGTWLDYTGTAWDFAQQYKNADILEIFRELIKDGKVSSGKSGTLLSLKGGRFGKNRCTSMNHPFRTSLIESNAIPSTLDFQEQQRRKLSPE